jgi:hypothetical protein
MQSSIYKYTAEQRKLHKVMPRNCNSSSSIVAMIGSASMGRMGL